MNRQDSGTPRWLFPMATATVIPLAAIAARLLAGEAFPNTALYVIAGVYAMGIAWAAMSLGQGAEQAGAFRGEAEEPERVFSGAPSWPAMELLQTVPAPPVEKSILIVGGDGVCPFKKEVGTRIAVGEDGRLSAPLCRAAVDALTPLLSANGADNGGQVSCRCPLPMRHREFEVTSARGAPEELVGVA